jgi:hypothetical protein
MRGVNWSRLAAATGIEFVVIAAALGIIGEIKEFETAGDWALRASNEMWGTYALLIGVSAVLLFWFTATASARLRQLEWAYGGSGRLAATFFASGGAIAALLTAEVAVQWTARQGGAIGGAGFAAFATAILEGPTILFPAAAYVGAAGLIGLRSEGLPTYSTFLAQLSLPLGAAFIAGAGLQLFKNYAWINDTGGIAFLAWVLFLSIIGVVRWAELDSGTARPPASAAPVRPPSRTVAPAAAVLEPEAPPRPAARARKPRPAKRAPRKPRETP